MHGSRPARLSAPSPSSRRGPPRGWIHCEHEMVRGDRWHSAAGRHRSVSDRVPVGGRHRDSCRRRALLAGQARSVAEHVRARHSHYPWGNLIDCSMGGRVGLWAGYCGWRAARRYILGHSKRDDGGSAGCVEMDFDVPRAPRDCRLGLRGVVGVYHRHDHTGGAVHRARADRPQTRHPQTERPWSGTSPSRSPSSACRC